MKDTRLALILHLASLCFSFLLYWLPLSHLCCTGPHYETRM